MDFALNVEYGNYNAQNRVLAFEGEYDYFRKERLVECKFHVNAIIKTTYDFKLNSDAIQLVTDSCSVQYRPKGLHQNTKGVFYKLSGKTIYLTDIEVAEMNEFIEKCRVNKENILIK